jgi:hypothetical protein
MSQSRTPTSAAFLTDGIRRLIDAMSEDPFVFIINGQNYILCLVEAILLSPRATSALQMDLTTRRFIINDSQIDSECFSTIISLIQSASV